MTESFHFSPLPYRLTLGIFVVQLWGKSEAKWPQSTLTTVARGQLSGVSPHCLSFRA